MANNRITEDQIIDKEVYQIGDKYSKGLQSAIEANDRWVKSFEPLKKAALNYSKIEKQFKSASNNKEFLKAKGAEKKLTEQVAAAYKEQERAEKNLIRTKERNKVNSESTGKALAKERLRAQELNKVNKEQAKIALGLVGPYDKLNKQLNEARKRAKDLGVEFGENSAQFKKASKEVNALDQRLKKLDSALGQSQRYVGNYERSLNGLRGVFTNLTGALGLAGGFFAFVQVLRNATKRIREFDKEMQNLAGIIGKDREELEGLERSIIAVAGSSIKTSNEVAKLATSLISLGKTEEEVMMLLEPVNNLGIALQTTGDQAGELLIQTLNAFGKGAESGQEFADIIAKVRTSTALDFERIQDSLGYVAPTASALGLTLEQTAAILGTLNDNGIKAARAGRLMNSSFGRLNQSGSSLEEALEKINNSTDKVSTATEIFGTESFSLGLILADNIEKTKEYTNQFENAGGALQDLTDKQLESIDAKIKILDSTWEEFVIGVENGQGRISQAFGYIVDTLTETLKFWGEFNKTLDTKKTENYNRVLDIQAKRYAKLRGQINLQFKAQVDLQNATKNWFRATERINELQDEVNSTWSKGAIEISILKKELEKVKLVRESYKAQMDAAQKVLDEDTKKTNENTKAKQEEARTVEFLQARIADLKKEQETALTKDDLDRSSEINATIEALQEEINLILQRNKETEKSSDLAEDRYNLIRYYLEQEIQQRNRVFENEDELFSQRRSALYERIELEERLARLNAERQLEVTKSLSEKQIKRLLDDQNLTKEELKNFTDEQILIYRQYYAQLGEIERQNFEDDTDLEAERLNREAERRTNIREREMNDALRLENEMFQAKKGVYADDTNAVETLERRKAEIKREYAIQALQDQITALEKILEAEQLNADETIKVISEIAEAKQKISEIRINVDVDTESIEEQTQSVLRSSANLSSELGNLLSMNFQKRIDQIDQEIEKNNEYYANLLENEQLTENERKALQKQRKKREDQLRIKQAKERRKQAITEKATAVAQAGINTALAITRVIPNPILIALASAIGAAQIATIIATEIPKYAKGTDNHPGGKALVGEERAEVISEPGKEPYVVDKPSILDLPKGTKVTPSLEEYQQLMRASILTSVASDNKKLNDFQTAQEFNGYNKEILEEMKRSRKAFEKQKQPIHIHQQKVDINYAILRANSIRWQS